MKKMRGFIRTLLAGWVDPGPDNTFQAQNQGGLTLQVGSPITCKGLAMTYVTK